MRAKFRAAVLTAAIVVPTIVAAPASAASPRVSVLASGLDGPRGVTTAGSATYVAETGTGGDLCETQEVRGEPVEVCYGATSRITRVTADGTVDREFVTGLPSVSMAGEGTGASDVSIAPDGTVYVAVGFGANVAARDALLAEHGEAFPEAAMLGTLVRVADDGSLEIVADLAAYEDAENPDGVTEDPEAGPDSNPDAVLATADAIYVADAGGNTVLAVDPDTGDIDVAAVLPVRNVPLPPEMGGGEMPMQPVPTSLTETADGDVLVGELTGFPFPVDGARVLRLTDDPTVQEVVADGFTNIMGVAERGQELYVVELARDGLLSGDLTGALVRVREDGTRADLLTEHLQFPGGLAVTADGDLHVSNGAVFPGGGQLLAFDAAPPRDAAIDHACPPGAVPAADLSDVAGSIHEEAIACTSWHGIFEGYDDGTFRPSRPITRAQFASTVARLVTSAGVELDAGSTRFSDVEAGSTHGAAILGLAEAGVIEGFGDGTFGPSRRITRAQATSLIVRAYELVTGDDLPSGADAWRDDDGSVHEPAIDAATAAGWIQGVRGGGFSPQRDITRAQVASVLARVASTLVADGELELPNA